MYTTAQYRDRPGLEYLTRFSLSHVTSVGRKTRKNEYSALGCSSTAIYVYLNFLFIVSSTGIYILRVCGPDTFFPTFITLLESGLLIFSAPSPFVCMSDFSLSCTVAERQVLTIKSAPCETLDFSFLLSIRSTLCLLSATLSPSCDKNTWLIRPLPL